MSRKKDQPIKKSGLGERLRKLREKKGLSQPELGAEIKIASITISRWEREVVTPEANQFPMLARYFQVSLDYLMSGENSPDNIHSPTLHRFLGTTAAGKKAAQYNLVGTLAGLRMPHGEPTLEEYRSVTNALVELIEASQDEEHAATETHKKPSK